MTTSEYYQQNKIDILAKQKIYRQTESAIKSRRISHWKDRGVSSECFDSLYNYYVNCQNCELCNIEITEDKIRKSTTRCLDHCHRTGEFRNVVCHACNIKRGK